MLEEDFAILETQQKEEVEQINLGFKQEISQLQDILKDQLKDIENLKS